MKNSLIKLLTGVIVLFTLQSYSSPKEKREIENGRFVVDTHNRQTNIQRVDSIDIIQLVKDRWIQIVSPDCMPDCINIFTFKQDGTFQDDNSEWGLVYDGQFKISGDTLFLTEYDYATQLPNENRIVPKSILTFIYMTDSLKFISNQIIEDGQIVTTYYPKNPFYCYRDKGSDSIRLEGTKWVHEVGKDCLDYILFKNDNQCEFYSCEIGKKYSGIYFYEENYITMSLSNSELREDNHKDVTIDRIEIRNNFLHFNDSFRLNPITGKWEKSDVIDNDYIFYRENN